jgi:hypothetical protein
MWRYYVEYFRKFKAYKGLCMMRGCPTVYEKTGSGICWLAHGDGPYWLLKVESTELGIFWLVRLLFSRLFRWARPLSRCGDILGFCGLAIDD